MEYLTYRKYKSIEESFFLTQLLDENDIKYQLEDIASAIDITFTGNTSLEDKVAIKIQADDFEKADELLKGIALNDAESIDDDHYLFEFSDKELIEVLENYDAWSEMDFLLARKILMQRGINYNDNEIEAFKHNRIEQLVKPDKGHIAWIVFGYISAVLGGLLGVFIGYYYFRFKKTVITGDRVYAYDLKTRQLGMRMMLIGAIAFVFWSIFYVI